MPVLQEVSDEAQFNSLIQYANPTTLAILYFHTPWAAPCAQMRTILETLASTYPSSSDITFLSINAEELADVSESYDVTAVPFRVLQRDGKVLETVSGSDAAKVRAAVEKHAGSGGAQKAKVPPALSADPSVAPKAKVDKEEGEKVNGHGEAKTFGAYKPDEGQTNGTPDGEVDKAELNTRLANLVKAAPVSLHFHGLG
jgi:thioredoxin-like negative regulator of GroEL